MSALVTWTSTSFGYVGKANSKSEYRIRRTEGRLFGQRQIRTVYQLSVEGCGAMAFKTLREAKAEAEALESAVQS